MSDVKPLDQETLLIAAKKIIIDYSQACSNVDEGNLYFAATQFQSAYDLALKELEGERAKVRKLRDAHGKIAAYFDCIMCDGGKDFTCIHHLEDRMEIASKALKETEGKK